MFIPKRTLSKFVEVVKPFDFSSVVRYSLDDSLPCLVLFRKLTAGRKVIDASCGLHRVGATTSKAFQYLHLTHRR